MRPPRIPPMVTDIIQAAICSFDGAQFTHLSACPVCGGQVQGYDTRQKKYAVIRDGNGERIITVRIKRFTCRNCNKLCNADEPFYPGTRIGSLVVDLFFCFSAIMPESRAARHIDAMGIRVDRTSWKNYSGRPMPEIPVTDIFGLRLPTSILTLSNLAARVPEGFQIDGAEALVACNYPSSFRPVPCSRPYAEQEDARGTSTPLFIKVRSGPVRHEPGKAAPPPIPLATSTVRY